MDSCLFRKLNTVNSIYFLNFLVISSSTTPAYYVTHVFVMLCLQPCCNISWLLCTLCLTSWKCKWFLAKLSLMDIMSLKKNTMSRKQLFDSWVWITDFYAKIPDVTHKNGLRQTYPNQLWQSVSYICGYSFMLNPTKRNFSQ